MKCVEFQNEFEEQNALSEDAETHLFHCRDCQKFESDQNRIWAMLGGLGQVEAPKDFNFRVKARIAETKLDGYKEETGFFPALRYVMPLGFVIVLLSFVALSGLYFVGTQSEQPIATQTTPTPKEVKVIQPEIAESDESEIIPEEKHVAEKNKNNLEEENPGIERKTAPENQRSNDLVAEKKGKTPKKTTEKPESGGGSKDLAGTKPPTIIQPEFDTNRSPKPKQNKNPSKSVDVKVVLDLAGIETDFKNGKYSVKSVRKNSMAERSKVKVGDIIEAINGKKITGEPLRGKTIDVNSITVLRGKNSIFIKLKAN